MLNLPICPFCNNLTENHKYGPIGNPKYVYCKYCNDSILYDFLKKEFIVHILRYRNEKSHYTVFLYLQCNETRIEKDGALALEINCILPITPNNIKYFIENRLKTCQTFS